MINSIFHTPNNEKWLYEDTWQEHTRMPYISKNYYLACYLDEKYIGLVIGMPSQEVRETHLQLHLAFLPEVYGKCVEICQEVTHWYLNNTKYDYLIAPVAGNNKLVTSLVRKCGFKLYTHQDKGWLKNDIEYGKDIYILSYSYNIFSKDNK
jgi:hypothetical protein